MVALYPCWYNFARINSAVPMSPAMACGLDQRLWDVGDIVKLIEQWKENVMGKLQGFAPLVFGMLLVLKAFDNPRLAALQGKDILQLIAIGLFFGLAVGMLVNAWWVRKSAQP